MRKVRDYDAELKALGDKAKELKAKKVQQLGELVVSTGAADAFDVETIAGILLSAYRTTDQAAKEAWRADGAAFFQRTGRKGKLGLRYDGKTGSEAATGDTPR